MELRFAKREDIPGMLALLEQVGEVHHQLRPDIFPAGMCKYDAPELEDILQEVNRPIFVAAEGEFVAGYCFCVRKTLVDHKELYIDDLCVDEHYRGSDVATALYRRACDYAKEIGCAFVTLNVWLGNDRARHFYEKMGMTPRCVTMEMPMEEQIC